MAFFKKLFKAVTKPALSIFKVTTKPIRKLIKQAIGGIF